MRLNWKNQTWLIQREERSVLWVSGLGSIQWWYLFIRDEGVLHLLLPQGHSICQSADQVFVSGVQRRSSLLLHGSRLLRHLPPRLIGQQHRFFSRHLDRNELLIILHRGLYDRVNISDPGSQNKALGVCICHSIRQVKSFHLNCSNRFVNQFSAKTSYSELHTNISSNFI